MVSNPDVSMIASLALPLFLHRIPRLMIVNWDGGLA